MLKVSPGGHGRHPGAGRGGASRQRVTRATRAAAGRRSRWRRRAARNPGDAGEGCGPGPGGGRRVSPGRRGRRPGAARDGSGSGEGRVTRATRVRAAVGSASGRLSAFAPAGAFRRRPVPTRRFPTRPIAARLPLFSLVWSVIVTQLLPRSSLCLVPGPVAVLSTVSSSCHPPTHLPVVVLSGRLAFSSSACPLLSFSSSPPGSSRLPAAP